MHSNQMELVGSGCAGSQVKSSVKWNLTVLSQSFCCTRDKNKGGGGGKFG